MAIFPDEFTIQEQFLKGIPYKMITLTMDEGLAPEVNTVKEFMAEAQAYENSVKTVAHYVGCSHHCTLQSGIVATKMS